MSVAAKKLPVPTTDFVLSLRLPHHRFTVDEYHKMIETGILTENHRVELLEGWVIDKMPQHPVHAGTISVVHRRLLPVVPRNWIIRGQSPITLENSEPEPDLAVVRGPEEHYLTAHPQMNDIDGLIEVADTSLEHDRTVKGPLYAQARIPWYWIVNLMETTVEVYTLPRAGKTPGYRQRVVCGIQEGVPVTVAGREREYIPVAYLFP